MNKNDLIDIVADEADIDKKTAKAALDATLGAIVRALKEGDTIQLIGFGSFKLKTRAARVGRNPRTGKEINIPETKVVTFASGKTLKEAVQ